jgi:hypothetical protein
MCTRPRDAHPGEAGLLAVERVALLLGRCQREVVDIDHAVGPLHRAAYRLRHRDQIVVRRFDGPIHLGHQRRQHRRARRRLDDLHVGAMTRGDALDLRADAQRDFVRLLGAHLLGQQADADVADVAAAAQVVVAHQAVEIHR